MRVTRRTKAKRAKDAGLNVGRTADPITLVVIDDNRLLREGLAALIHTQAGFTVLSASEDVPAALQLARDARPHVILLDFGLADHDSLSLTAEVHRDVPTAKVIVMGLLALQHDVADFVRAGASGFIMKDASFDDCFATIRAVASGAEVLPPALTTSLFSQIAHSAMASDPRLTDAVRLTNRELEVIDLLGEGLSNKEIATRLTIAIHTVKSHVHNVLEKLALRSRLEVVAFAHGTGVSRSSGA